MVCYVEHIQYECSDLDQMTSFYSKVFDWHLRGSGTEIGPEKTYAWVHIGTDSSYVSFRSPYNGANYDISKRHYTDHFGVVVDNLSLIIDRLNKIGVEYTLKGDHPYRKRIYIKDPDGNEIEVIQYLSEEASERNDYSFDAR